jgi:hypothetical protein
MSNEKDVSKELTDAVNKVLSRRDAVKKAGSIAAGAALAFLGLSMPGVSHQREAKACCGRFGCFGTCDGSCNTSCGGSCWDDCTGGCTEYCNSTCSTECSGTES